MIKNKTILEIVKNEKTFQLSLDPNASLGEIFDALCEMRQFVVDKINEAHKAQMPPETAAPVAEEPKA